jgi:hypothetical protein
MGQRRAVPGEYDSLHQYCQEGTKKDANDGLLFDLIPYRRLYKLLVKESRGEYKDNLCYLETIKDNALLWQGWTITTTLSSKLTVQTNPTNRPE